jgi:CubicO group peptidase (beta-lactamase class C family)
VTIWNTPESPGGVIGIIENEAIIYTRPFGMASLDYDIPVTDNTLFNIGSISKQYTALGIIKLSREGKLSIDDDIRMYFPDLPDFGHTITIRQLMHHTSGSGYH